MNTLKWAYYPGSTVSKYRLYHSTLGFRGYNVDPADVAGKTLKLRMNGDDNIVQTITFNGTDPVYEQFENIRGGYAEVASNPAYFYFRSSVPIAPGSVEIVGGSALTDLGLTARKIEEKSEDQMIAEITATALLNDAVVTYEHEDGIRQDWYAISTVDDDDVESEKSAYMQAQPFSGSICVLEGDLSDLQGVALADAVVRTKLIRFPHAPVSGTFISRKTITYYTDADGRFSIPLLQGALVQIEIPAIGFSRTILVPEKNYEFIEKILVETDDRFGLGVI